MPLGRKRASGDRSDNDTEDALAAIVLEVEGLPPAKSETRSLFSEGHGHAARVRRLLEVAARRTADTGFRPWTGPVGLELVLWSGPDADPWDATNYLGGVADVLQEKTRVGIPLDHLDELRHVALYLNDRQIEAISYRRERGERPSYRVRVWLLSEVVSDGR